MDRKRENMTDYYLAFDVGGTTIKYGLVDKNLNISHTGKVATEKNKDGHILKMLKKVTSELKNEYYLIGIGVSTAGIVGKNGEIAYAGPTILDYTGTPIKAELEKDFNLPTNVVNDVDAALLGEKLAGNAKGYTSIYCVALGTGIGGAYYEAGKMFSGAHGTANNIGWTLYDVKTKTNFEQRASTLSLQAKLAPLGVDPIEGFKRAKTGSSQEKKIIEDWSLEVAEGLSNILLLFDPEVLIIGGAVSKQGDYLKKLLEKQLKKILPPNLCKTKIKMASLGNKAQLYGAIDKFFD